MFVKDMVRSYIMILPNNIWKLNTSYKNIRMKIELVLAYVENWKENLCITPTKKIKKVQYNPNDKKNYKQP